MLDFLKTIFGDQVVVSEYTYPDKTPVYIRDGYKPRQLVWNGNHCVLLSPAASLYFLYCFTAK